MKKIIVLIALLFIMSEVSQSQGYTFTLTGTKVKLSSVLDSIYRISYTSMASVQYYTWTITATGDSSVSASRNSSGTYSWLAISHTGENYQFESSGSKNSDIWIWSTNGGSFAVTIKFIKIVW